jgi:hypothetical protein
VAVPFGIYDVAKNAGYITVGISHNTAEFAVNCLVNWWKFHGRSEYTSADRLLFLPTEVVATDTIFALGKMIFKKSCATPLD